MDIIQRKGKIFKLEYTGYISRKLTNPATIPISVSTLGMIMMTDLDKAISAAFASKGKQEDVNKVYLLLLRSLLFIPVSKEKPADKDEPFSPLFAKIDNSHYMLAFDTLERLKAWAGDHMNAMNYVELSGHDFIKGIHNEVCFCLNVGTSFYKEFLPDEIKRLKTIVSRIEQMKQG